MAPPRLGCLAAALAVAAVLLVGAAVRGEPDAGSEIGRVAAVEVDPEGRISIALAAVYEALEDGRHADAREALVRLREDHGGALVPVPAEAAGPTPLHWPAPRVVELLLTKLPPDERRAAGLRWRPVARALLARAEDGDAAALETLAREWAATDEGAAALRLLAHRDLEEGRFASAAERLERWLFARPDAEGAVRAAAVLALVDARGRLGDEAGLSSIVERFPAAARRPVETARGRTTPRLRTRQHQARLRAAERAVGGGIARGSVLPRDPVVLWTRAYDRRGVVTGPHGAPHPARIAAAVAGDEENLFLHEGRFVRRLEPWTGHELWRFPSPEPHAWGFDRRELYEEPALPLYTLTLTDEHVVTVLGTPAVSGSFVVHGAEFQTADEPRESRARLVVLDRRTGDLVWTTGTGEDTHPVLGDAATSCASPPLVAGDVVFAIFARRRGATEFHLACLELATGAPRWVTFLATGESGRESDVSSGGVRFVKSRLRAPPWGAPPALADGEVCVLPQAGFAAGVAAGSGRLAWIRALPRYPGNFQVGASEGFAGRDAPIRHAGLWILAPFDSPRLLAIEARTGRFRWSTPTARDAEGPPWHHLHGVRDVPRGGPWLGLEGTGPVLVPLRRPTERSPAPDVVDASPTALLRRLGRAFDAGTHLVWVQFAEGQEFFGTSEAADRAALYAAPWGGGPVRSVPIEGHGVPFAGDVHRLGSIWIVAGAHGAAAIAARGDGERHGEPLIRARLARDARAAAKALAHASDPGARDRAVDVARVCLAHDPSGVAALGDALLELGGERAHVVLLEALTSRASARSGSAARHVALVDRLIAEGGDHLVVTEAGLYVRVDLRAGALLDEWRDDPAYHPALRARETEHEKLVHAAASAPEPVLREAIRRAIGTPAAAEGRSVLRRRLAAAGRFGEAAAVAADLRLDRSTGAGLRPGKRRRHAAEQQAAEASWRARAGDVEAARSLLTDLDRWAGSSDPALPDGQGRASELLEDLTARHGWRPESPRRFRRVFPLWPEGEGILAAADVRGVVVPEWQGPGSGRPLDRFLVSRGLGLEIWSRSNKRRIAGFPDAGEGWFGGTLQEVARWVPGGGVIVASLVAREPADAAGLRAGDWILTWDGEAVTGASDFMQRIAAAEPGLPVEVAVRRAGRLVLQRFTPGRRPVRDGRVVERERVWVDERGRALVPGRVDLVWIDLESAGRETLWTWREQGVIRSVIVDGGAAVVTIRRIREADVIVAVDLGTGTERWRRAIDGSVSTVEPTGSALVVNSVWPARVSVLDAYDGTVRARAAVLQRRTRPRSRCWTHAPVSVNVHGRLWWIAGGSPSRELRVLNTTTARVEWGEARGDLYGHEPLLAADGVVAVAPGGETLEILAPDPVGGGVAWRVLRMPPDEEEGGVLSLGYDSRLFLAGRTLWVVGLEGARWIVEVYEIDPALLGPPTAPGEVAAERVLRLRGRVGIGPSRVGRPYLLDARATPEGLRLGSATTGDRMLRRAEWVGAGGEHVTWIDPDAGGRGVVQIRRHTPSRVGDHLAVPTDRGVLFVPLAVDAAR